MNIYKVIDGLKSEVKTRVIIAEGLVLLVCLAKILWGG